MSISTYFANPTVWGIGLAIVFGGFWLILLNPHYLKNPWLWIALIAGAALFSPAIVWVQAPLQTRIGQFLAGQIGIIEYQKQILWTGIPVVLLSGLVQEGAKMLPATFFWLFKRRSISPAAGISIGVMAGAGFGIFEAQHFLNSIFASGWNWSVFQAYGFLGIAGFWERFFAIAFHISSAGLTGWGLSRGRGWQFYLLASFLHFSLNFPIVLMQKGILSSTQIEIIIAVFASLLFAVIFWLNRRTNRPNII